MLVEMEVTGLTVDQGSNTPIVVLKERDGERVLPIWIGVVEASAIAFELEKLQLNRPMTHDLIKNAVESLGGTIERVCVVDLRENTYYARVEVSQSGKRIEIDSRPSDAIAVALRAQAPIWCDHSVIEKSKGKEAVIGKAAARAQESSASETPPPRPRAKKSRKKSAASEEASQGPRPILGAAREELGELLEKLEPEDFGKYKM
ncbi:MAG: bifunctional nuclease family protein [Myxococcota bacterium]